MKFKSIKIDNYKSIGEDKNMIFLEDKVTALIGKNESGKSNLLEAIGGVGIYHKPKPTYFKQRNRISNNDIKINALLYFTKEEWEKYNINESTNLSIENTYEARIDGGLSKVISQNENLKKVKDKVLKFTRSEQQVWNLDYSDHDKKNRRDRILFAINNCFTVLLLNPKGEIQFLKNILKSSFTDKEELINCFDILEGELSKCLKMLPDIYYRNADQYLEHYYDLKTIQEIFKKKTGIFYRFMQAANISEEEILMALNNKEPGNKISTRRRIKKKIKTEIQDRFNDFYKQESIEFSIEFDDSAINFIVSSNDGEVLRLSERSNGLRWYLSLFIDILSENIQGAPTLFLFDEPGVHLHVNAQKELLKLFDDLARKNHQIIYTSHSPSMINGDDLTSIRVVEKINEYTKIFNSCYDSGIPDNSKRDTLSPLVKAIGADLKFNLGAQSQKCNIITEGITDFIYLRAMLKALNIKDTYYIIPAVGASNVKNIAMIIHGWGYDFKILFDYDDEGFREYNKITKELEWDNCDNIFFVNGKTPLSSSDVQRTPAQIESLISNNDKSKLINNTNTVSKKLLAKEFYDKVLNGEITPDEETIENFKRLFEVLGVLKREVIQS